MSLRTLPADWELGALVFDMDGLMLDTERIHRTAWQTAAAAFGYEVDDALYMTFIGRRTADCEQDLVARFGDAFPMEQFRHASRECRHRIVSEGGMPVKPGLLDLLAFAEHQRIPLAVATSSGRQTAAQSLQQAGLEGRFGVVVSGDQVTHGKPAPDIYLEAAARLGVDPARCIALEDSSAGILAASRAGMVSLLIPDLARPSDEAAAAAFRVLDGLAEAHRLIEQLSERPAFGLPAHDE